MTHTDPGSNHPDQNDHGAIVEEAFAFHQDEQITVYSGFSKKGDDGNWVGRCHQHAKKSSVAEAQPEQENHNRGRYDRRDENPDSRQERDRDFHTAKAIPLDGKSGLENKWGQKNEENQLRVKDVGGRKPSPV